MYDSVAISRARVGTLAFKLIAAPTGVILRQGNCPGSIESYTSPHIAMITALLSKLYLTLRRLPSTSLSANPRVSLGCLHEDSVPRLQVITGLLKRTTPSSLLWPVELS